MKTDLLESTLELARKSDVPVKEICEAAKVKPRWYYALLAGRIPDPGVRRVQRLYDYLVDMEAAKARQKPNPSCKTRDTA